MVGIETVEEPPFELIRVEGDFEVRDYRTLVVVETVAPGTMEDAQRPAFRRLFRYISGNNLGDLKIEMTAPVAMQPEGKMLSRIGPAFTEATREGWKMSFVLPTSFTLSSAPHPKDPLVMLSEIPPRRVASVRFSGWWSEENLETSRDRLMKWLDSSGIAYNPATFRAAGYNPPWTLPFLRRNEIQVDLTSP